MGRKKHKDMASRYSAYPYRPLRGWEPSKIGTIVKTSGMFVQARRRHPMEPPRILLVPLVTARVVSERMCVFFFTADGEQYFPAEWHPQADPAARRAAETSYTLDFRAFKEEAIEREIPAHTITDFRLVPPKA